jgi:hypothetical protein
VKRRKRKVGCSVITIGINWWLYFRCL